ncbi:MAG: hypothetical protein LBI56_04220 [Puniceicoccales bacterium]|jgi:hypothetical protein|nr:hypothetical protein [Puniceicoccales bacterium]
MLRNIVRFCDFVDRVLLRCLLEGIFVGIFSFLAMLAAWAGGGCANGIKIFRKKYGGKPIN